MKKLILILSILFLPYNANAALDSSAFWELNALATASNVNAGYFNRSNANFFTDYTATSATGNSPVISSASYNFVAGDVGGWIYVKAGTNWTKGFYKITSVASNAATVDATIGAAIQRDETTLMWGVSTVAGCATTASPTGGTCGVDFSQQAAAEVITTDLACVTPSANVTSATGGWRASLIGNGMHITAITGTGTLVGWYEVLNYVDANTLTLDRTPAPSNNGSAGTARVGGALSLNSTLDDDFTEVVVAGNIVFMCADPDLDTVVEEFILGESISTTAAGTAALPINVIGYYQLRGDNPTGTNRPEITGAARNWLVGAYWNLSNLIMTSTAASVWNAGASSYHLKTNCKAVNLSTTSARIGYVLQASSRTFDCEGVSYNGTAFTTSGAHLIVQGCYAHDSGIGFDNTFAANAQHYIDNLVVGCFTNAISSLLTTAASTISHNTLYGFADTRGTGILLVTGTLGKIITDNIITGFATGISHEDATGLNGNGIYADYNNFFNNDTPRTNIATGIHDQALDPTFTNVGQVTGSTATYTGSTLTQAGGDFSTVVAGRDYIYISSGTGLTTAMYYGITTVGATTIVTDLDAGESSASDWTYSIITGRDFSIGTNLKAKGFPGAFQGGYTTGYTDIGGVQRQEAGTGGGGGASFFSME